ncbi:hypothetical protein [Nocardioides sp. LHG3406-4]|uniref:hypothetical protein n=1 Tax=Nocardioides sp. LHG3406-4 TaxID=2804575 RepID=UPI003CEA7DA8
MEYWQDDKRIARLSDAGVAPGEVYDWDSGTWLPDAGVGEGIRPLGDWISITEEKELLLTEAPQGWLGPSAAEADCPPAPTGDAPSTASVVHPQEG